MSLKWRALLSSVMTSPTALLCPTGDVTHPFIQHLHAVLWTQPPTAFSREPHSSPLGDKVKGHGITKLAFSHPNLT